MIYAASDFHMGDGGPRDDFTQDCTKRLLDQEKALKGNTVLLLGDIIDGHRYDFAASMQAHAEELQMLGRLHAYWIVGNHDEGVWRYEGTIRDIGFRLMSRCLLRVPKTMREDRDRWLYLCHGHEFDPACSGRFAWVGRKAAGVANWLGRRWPRLEDRVAGAAGRLQGTGRYAGSPFFDAATGHVEHWHQAHGVVCGHTHAVAKTTFGAGKSYYNTGMYREHDWMEVYP